MNILYIAYSCMPHKGSEEKIGWNIPFVNAENNRVFVVTKEEHRQAVEDYLSSNNITNPTFFFVDINPVYKKLFKGVAYSVRLNLWHKKAMPVVRELCRREHIDVIHQITPVEFRSIGNYMDIDGIPFVCGPLGGGEKLPSAFRTYAKGNMLVEHIRTMLNIWAKFTYKITKKLQKCSYIMFANKETEAYLSSLTKGVPSVVCSEIGIENSDISAFDYNPQSDKPLSLLVAGRLAYRKGHSLLFDVLSSMPQDFQYTCRIVGDGPERQRLEDKCKSLGIDNNVTFVGKIPFTQMEQEYAMCDVFLMPSIRETTGSVLLEAMSRGIPVITINQFGGKVLMDGINPFLYNGDTLDECKLSIRAALLKAASEPETRRKCSQSLVDRARQHTFENKVIFYNSIYDKIINKE